MFFKKFFPLHFQPLDQATYFLDSRITKIKTEGVRPGFAQMVTLGKSLHLFGPQQFLLTYLMWLIPSMPVSSL